jgi:3-hydroxyisobutyrate dehydrogenase-like beta-hydroxyacid dehydrogenase
VERARPLLETLGSTLVHVGDRPGDGDTAKTLNNMLSATNLAAAAEALAIALREGLDPERLVDCVNGGTGASHAMREKVGGQVLSGRFDSRFTLGQYLKDLGIAHALAAEHRVPAPVNAAAQALWTSHAARGAADEDHTRLVALLLADAGVALSDGRG